MKMKPHFILSMLLIFTFGFSHAQNTSKDFPILKGPYLGQKPPGITPEVFAPEIVSSSGATEYGIAFTPDGKEFYFNRNGVGVMVCTWSDTGWTAPVKAPFLKKYKGGAVHIMYDGKRLLMNRYHDSHELKEGETGGIWALQKTEGDWENPKFFIASGMRATSTLDGNIYTTDISGFRKEGKDQGIIAKYIYSDSGYLRAADPDGGVNTENSEAHPFIAPDESYIIFDSTRPGGKGKGDLYIINYLSYSAHPFISPDESYLIYDAQPQEGNADLFISFKKKDGTWTKSVSLGEKFNTDWNDMVAFVSRDGQYLFFSRLKPGKGDIYWVDAKIIENLKPKELKQIAQ